jgi:hypothetical protein
MSYWAGPDLSKFTPVRLLWSRSHPPDVLCHTACDKLSAIPATAKPAIDPINHKSTMTERLSLSVLKALAPSNQKDST